MRAWTRVLSPLGAVLFILGMFLGRPLGPLFALVGFLTILVSLVLTVIRLTAGRPQSP
jgi:uncharacterized membrane protein